MPNILEIRNLHKTFGTYKALNGLDMDVPQGDIFGFLGSNGAGKSTTIRCILLLPTTPLVVTTLIPLQCNRITRTGLLVHDPCVRTQLINDILIRHELVILAHAVQELL